jgi:alpha-tubulin suppressor-like RCC1 family protein
VLESGGGLLTGVVAISAGAEHSMALKADGTVWVFGQGLNGQLGNGDTAQQSRAIQVPGLAGVTAIEAGGNHSLALVTDGDVAGSLWAWGMNDGQLGDGSTAQRSTPIKVLDGVATMSAGSAHTLVRKADGSLWGTGQNGEGELGDGTTTSSLVFLTALEGAPGIEWLSAGSAHSLALSTGGEIFTTGSNDHGQVGDGTTLDRSLPVRMALLESVVDIAAGIGIYHPHSAALTADGRIWTWGDNFYGALGSGGAAEDGRLRPQALEGFSVSDQAWPFGDPDGDGLLTREELAQGTDPFNADSNGDGISDLAAVRSGMSATNPDMDGDGIANAVERTQGTDPLRSDTDGDGVADGTDCFPVDPTRSACPEPVPGDVTPPQVDLTEPVSAVLVSSVP